MDKTVVYPLVAEIAIYSILIALAYMQRDLTISANPDSGGSSDDGHPLQRKLRKE